MSAVSLGRALPRPQSTSTHVTLIRPNVIVFPKSLSLYGPVPPIGLAYIAAVLVDAGHKVDVIDSAGEAIDKFNDFDTPVGTLRAIGLTVAEIVDRIDPGTQVVGISHTFLHEWPHVRELCEAIRARLPDVFLMVGGENATAFHKWMFADTDVIDACVLGEGEATALELVARIGRGLSVDDVPGIATANGGEVTDTGLSIRITKQLDEVPRPAWDLFPIDEYFRFADFYGVNRGRSLPVMATRGCPYRCSFCSSPQMWTTRYVVRDPDEVADEIADFVAEYGISNVNFADLTAITKRKWTLRFCDALEQKAPGITWQLPVGTRAEALDAEVLQRLWDTGCRNITYAPEAGGERMLKIYDKRVNLDHLLSSMREAAKIGIVSKANIIIGHPDETWPDVWKSFTFLMKAALAGVDDTAVMMFGPYPGSADFQRLVDEGRLEIDEHFHYVGLARASSSHESYNPRMSARQLRTAQMAMLCAFYGVALLVKPRRVIDYIRAQRSGQETSSFDAFVRTKRRGFRALPANRRSPRSPRRTAA